MGFLDFVKKLAPNYIEPSKPKKKPKPKPKPRPAPPRLVVNPSTGAAFTPGPTKKPTLSQKPNPKLGYGGQVPIAARKPGPAVHPGLTNKPQASQARSKKVVTSGSRKPKTGTSVVKPPVKASVVKAPPKKPVVAKKPAPVVNTDKILGTRAANAAAIEYDPKLKELERLSAQTTLRGKEGAANLGSMFEALSKDITARGATTAAGYDTSKKSVADAYTALQSQIGGNYDAEAASNAKALGMAGVAPAGLAATAQASSDELNAKNVAAQHGQNVSDALEILKQGASTRATESSLGATTEGKLRTADLDKQVRDALTEYGGQKVDLQGSKGRLTRELTDQYRNEQFTQEMARKNLGYQYDQLAAQMGLSTKQLAWEKQKTGILSEQAAAELGVKAQTSQAKAAADAAAAGIKQKAADYKNATPLVKLQIDADRLAGISKPTHNKVSGGDYTKLVQYAIQHPPPGKPQPRNAQEAGLAARYWNNKKFLRSQNWHQVDSFILQDLAGQYFTNTKMPVLYPPKGK